MTNLSSRTYDEKRDFIRMKVDTEVILTLDGENKELKGHCRDLSGTGMLIEVAEAIKEGATCSTTLPSGNDAFPSLDATIKVLRCKQLGDSTYQVGAEILSIDK
ncbi:MAG: PilZ domain-containing protein [Oleiphilaceae bacterium]|nr:PilZ domain-containing protein [Oleiphilaceae bacterium]